MPVSRTWKVAGGVVGATVLLTGGVAIAQEGEPADDVELADVGGVADRSLGDVHPLGNPHVHMDPVRVQVIVAALAERMAELDPHHAHHYRDHARAFIATIAILKHGLMPCNDVHRPLFQRSRSDIWLQNCSQSRPSTRWSTSHRLHRIVWHRDSLNQHTGPG